MGTIIKKNKYYYYVESSRVNGKPRIVYQKYLGTARKILKTMTNEDRKDKSES